MDANILDLSALPQYLQRKIIKLISDYEKTKEEAGSIEFDVCPKCGCVHPKIIKGGKTKGGKQMYRCKSCGNRFTEDHGSLTHGSHQSMEAWNDFITMTLDKMSLKKIAMKMGISTNTAFAMRHKFMASLDKFMDGNEVSGIVEADETYVINSFKGKKMIKGRIARSRGERASKRGLSDDLACIFTATDRNKGASAAVYNMGKPSTKDALLFSKHIGKGSHLITDDLASYNKMSEARECSRTILKGGKAVSKFENMNTVNSFHSFIKWWYEKMRGVATKYLNRYSNLFAITWITRDMDNIEALLYALSKAKHDSARLTINEISTKNVLKEYKNAV